MSSNPQPYERDNPAKAAGFANVAVVQLDRTLRPLVPRMTRLIEGYAEFLRWALRNSRLDAVSTTVHDLRALAKLFGMTAVVELCARIEWAAVAHMDDEACRYVDQLAGLVHNATFIYS
jgi:hypothetical protein